MNIILFYILPIIIVALTNIGEPDFSDIFGYSFIPGINILIAGVSIALFFHRIYKSKGKCIVKHKFVMTYDSESEKWKNGRMPLRVSIGGHTDYKCYRCQETKTTSWKAF